MSNRYDIVSYNEAVPRVENNKMVETNFRGTVYTHEDGWDDIGYIQSSTFHKFNEMGQGPSVELESETLIDDRFTDPDLHRRIESSEREYPEISPREYTLMVSKVNSYRTTGIEYHDEEVDTLTGVINEDTGSDLSEIP